jgi:hypothetical protein
MHSFDLLMIHIRLRLPTLGNHRVTVNQNQLCVKPITPVVSVLVSKYPPYRPTKMLYGNVNFDDGALTSEYDTTTGSYKSFRFPLLK